MLCATGIACQAVVLAQGAASDSSDSRFVVAPRNLSDLATSGPGPNLNRITPEGHWIHILPNNRTRELMAASANVVAPPLLYGSGGSIMPKISIYSIFWAPATLQSGAAAGMATAYKNVLSNIATDYVGHGISSNNTQYYQIIAQTKTYVSGTPYLAGGGSNAGAFVDTNPYPVATAACANSSTPVDCISDAQLRAEVQRVMALKGWTGGLTKLYMVYTASGEDECDGTGACGSTVFCGYHSNIPPASVLTAPTLYSIVLYGDPVGCGGAGYTSPNGNPAADAAADTATHEISETITDPLGNAWSDSAGNEIGDKCSGISGTKSYDNGLANQQWNGHFYDIQEEWDNHTGGCVQVGP